MSRTYRLKNAHDYWHDDLAVWEWHVSKYGGQFLYRRNMQPHEQEYQKGKAKRHKDGRGHGVPHWYTNLYFERSFRRNAKSELKKFISKQNTEEDVILEKFRHGIGYQYY